jgi:hypothetical protein
MNKAARPQPKIGPQSYASGMKECAEKWRAAFGEGNTGMRLMFLIGVIHETE